MREIHRLRGTVQELEAQLKRSKGDRSPASGEHNEEPSSRESSGNSFLYGIPNFETPKSDQVYATKEWEGVHIQSHGSSDFTYHGPLASAFFGHRMQEYLVETLREASSETLSTSHLRLHGPPISVKWQSQLAPSTNAYLQVEPQQLSRAHEQYFLDLFWQSFHCMYPIVLEAEFDDYYQTLWRSADDQKSRQASTLADSILAICIQFGSAFLRSDADHDSPGEKSSHVENGLETAHYYFRRCQLNLLQEMEGPSIMALQSQIYCVVYLMNMSWFTSADTMLAAAVRTAEALHINSLNSNIESRAHREMHERVWHSLIALGQHISLILGRTPISHADITLGDSPKDGHEHAMLSGSMLFSPNHEDITWLSFHKQYTLLLRKAHAVQKSLYQNATKKLEQRNAKSIYDQPILVEELAGCLGREVRTIYDWAHNVPQSLKIARKGSGEAFSTERTALHIDGFSPLWLQRQRVLLEVLYHHIQLSNLRTFLRFPPGSSSITPLSDCHSINCLNHAIILTNILHQVLSETDILRGWSPIFQCQWDAALCIVGFVLSNPVCPPTPAARKSIQTAISSFECMGKYLSKANEAAQIIREVGAQAELLVERFHNSLSTRPPPETRRVATSAAVQTKAAPALTPEYLQGLTADTEFDISEFINEAIVAHGDQTIPIDDSALQSFTDDVQAGFTTPWINDAAVLESLGLFTE